MYIYIYIYIYTYISIYIYIYIYIYIHVYVILRPNTVRTRSTCVNATWYGVATIGRLLKIIGLFCRISSLL